MTTKLSSSCVVEARLNICDLASLAYIYKEIEKNPPPYKRGSLIRWACESIVHLFVNNSNRLQMIEFTDPKKALEYLFSIGIPINVSRGGSKALMTQLNTESLFNSQWKEIKEKVEDVIQSDLYNPEVFNKSNIKSDIKNK